MRPFILSSLAISIGVLAGVLAAQNDLKLAEPFATPSAKNTPKVIPRPATGQLKLPAGFTVEEYLDGIERPRYMALGPSKELLISDTRPNGIVWLVQGPGKEKKMLLEKLDRPYGIAFWKEYLYVAEATSIKRYKYDAKTMTPGPGEEVVSLKEFAKGPSTRSVVFDRKGAKMYVSIAMEADAETGEDPRRAAINRYNPDGSGHEIFASGLRNAVGVHLYPGTDTPWVGVEERDALGDDLVPDIFTHIQPDGFYGWPYAYIGKHEDPRFKGMRPDLVAKTIPPDVILPAHVSMLDFAFYEGKQFPQQYRGGAFLAWHGSTNRSELQGYEVAFVPFTKGKPSGPPQHFLTGWMDSPQGHEVWGRPVAVLEMPDGSLLVSDDGGKKIWRVSYNGK
jgi:glucose/arabinose dehydrogenase